MENNGSSTLTTSMMIKRFIIMFIVTFSVGIIGTHTIFNSHQAIACSIFIAIIMGTLFFWNFRLAIAFLGVSVLILTNALDIETFVLSSTLEVILFLVGMMIIVGALKDLGFFTWVVQRIVAMPNITGRKFIVVTSLTSAFLACAVDEVTSIIFISTIIFHVSERLKISPLPYIIICVLCTNVGSAGTMMGNPVGIYIGTKAGLTFGDFMHWAFPLMVLALMATVVVVMLYYRKELDLFDQHLKERLDKNLSLITKVEVPYKEGLLLLTITVLLISVHHQLETWLGLGKNTILLIAPLICAGIVMIVKRDRARDYVEKEVDWWTLLFFMLLFSIAGTIEHTHVDKVIAEKFALLCGTSLPSLVSFILFVSAAGSAFVDNVIFVAAFAPIVEQLSTSIQDLPLWWALLFGACFGGNITMIGSTANIVALGMLEKRSKIHVTFMQWFKVGFIASIVACLVALVGILSLSPFMPDRYSNVSWTDFKGIQAERFQDKNVHCQAKIGEVATYSVEKYSEQEYSCYKIYNIRQDYTSQDSTEQEYIYAYILKNTPQEEQLKNNHGKALHIQAKASYHPESKEAYPVILEIEKLKEIKKKDS